MSKKIRIFAGPNGSGKTTLFNRIKEHYHYNIGIFVNADSIESQIKSSGKLPFGDFKIEATKAELIDFFYHSTLAKRAEIDLSGSFEVNNNTFLIKK